MNKTKIEYLKCKFSNLNNLMLVVGVKVRLDTHVIQRKVSFKYIGSIIQGNRESYDDVTHHSGPGR